MMRSTPKARTETEKRWLRVLSTLNEFQARLFVADKALDLGRGGISWLSQLTGMSRTTITKAVPELHRGKEFRVPPEGGARQPGGGRKNWSKPTRGPGFAPHRGGEHGRRSREPVAVDAEVHPHHG